MPNSGFQGQINQKFYGTHKGDLVPLGDRYVSGNLPNPAFWRRFIQEPASSFESSSPRVLTTTEVLAPIRPSNVYAMTITKDNRSTSNTLPRLETSSTRSTNEGSDHAPSLHPKKPPTSLGRARDSNIPLVALNSLAPFATTYKPTCGYFFSRATDNKKKQMGIPATDLVKYRYYVK
ncbi:uncharacterized protein LOC121405978 [Lytechinus variegatus]|uniref:uncharacterized protein LOC121405978 n=1 Tax=Lytechinus variegatus TaxID=7654 RepID=UPI001BB21493|nr:uncharacterized protein LOC121405978 [Lytechinus variegatus]